MHRHRQRDPPPRPLRSLHFRAGLDAKDVLRQDDRRLADLLPDHPPGRSPLPPCGGQVQGRFNKGP